METKMNTTYKEKQLCAFLLLVLLLINIMFKLPVLFCLIDLAINIVIIVLALLSTKNKLLNILPFIIGTLQGFILNPLFNIEIKQTIIICCVKLIFILILLFLFKDKE